MDPTPTLHDTPVISRNPGVTKTGDGNLTDRIFPTSFLSNHLQSEINYSREENENKNSIVKVLLENILIRGPSTLNH